MRLVADQLHVRVGEEFIPRAPHRGATGAALEGLDCSIVRHVLSPAAAAAARVRRRFGRLRSHLLDFDSRVHGPVPHFHLCRERNRELNR